MTATGISIGRVPLEPDRRSETGTEHPVASGPAARLYLGSGARIGVSRAPWPSFGARPRSSSDSGCAVRRLSRPSLAARLQPLVAHRRTRGGRIPARPRLSYIIDRPAGLAIRRRPTEFPYRFAP